MRIIVITMMFWWVALLGSTQTHPPTKKVTVVGAARGQFYGDVYQPNNEDTVTAKKLNSGNVLADLGLKIQANSNMEILGMVRIRNDYGGFWGSGVSFDVRQLYVRGLVGNAIRYQLGDINYRMTPYTLWNYQQEIFGELPVAFSTQMQTVNYDHFYNNDHSWRQQGASANVGFQFAKGIKEVQLNAVSTRIKTSDFANQSDRIFVGLNATILQSEKLQLGLNYADILDIVGTSKNTTRMRNPIYTGSAHWKAKLASGVLNIHGEAGISASYTEGSTQELKNGKFNDWKAAWSSESNVWSLEARFQYVNSDFRSPGAQTRRVNPNGALSAYERIGNEQSLRPLNMLDLMRETNLYNMQLQTSLGAYLPQYDNLTPYGDATPNRQAFSLKGDLHSANGLVNGVVLYYNGRETRGEGTVEPRQFSRLKTDLSLVFNEKSVGWKSQLRLSAGYRKDNTHREAPEYLPQINLDNNVVTVGTEWLFNKKWELLMGAQQLQYKGIEMSSVRDFNGEIVNFKEMDLDGKEWMTSLGLRYFFSTQSYLSLQRFQWKGPVSSTSNEQYGWGQWMILYQMNF